MREELFGPVVTTYVYDEDKWDDTLRLIDRTAPYGLTGAVFSEDRAAIDDAKQKLRYAAGQLLRQRQADRRGRRPAAVRRRARVGHERQGRLDVEPDPLGQPAVDQGDVHAAARLPLPVHGGRRLGPRTSRRLRARVWPCARTRSRCASRASGGGRRAVDRSRRRRQAAALLEQLDAVDPQRRLGEVARLRSAPRRPAASRGLPVEPGFGPSTSIFTVPCEPAARHRRRGAARSPCRRRSTTAHPCPGRRPGPGRAAAGPSGFASTSRSRPRSARGRGGRRASPRPKGSQSDAAPARAGNASTAPATRTPNAAGDRAVDEARDRAQPEERDRPERHDPSALPRLDAEREPRGRRRVRAEVPEAGDASSGKPSGSHGVSENSEDPDAEPPSVTAIRRREPATARRRGMPPRPRLRRRTRRSRPPTCRYSRTRARTPATRC